jgi:Zn-dependent protease with chaperone function
MRSAAEETVQPCPECGTEIRVDGRFTLWCAACDWNVDPTDQQEEQGKQGRLERTRRGLALRHGEKLLAEVEQGGRLHARRDAAAVLAYAIALAVHGVTVVLLAAGVFCLVWDWGGGLMPLGLVLMATAVALGPRRPKRSGVERVLHRADAPELFALVDEVAQVVGTRGVDVIAVDEAINASVSSSSLRGRRSLSLGLPLWEVLTPQQKVALLGHELGHYSNGDTRHAVVVATALRSLTTWRYYFTPIHQPSVIEMVVNVAFVVPRLLVQGMLSLLDHLTLRATQRSEYLADREAARAASTMAAVGLMDQLLITDSVAVFLRREASSTALVGRRSADRAADRADEFWARLSAHTASVPEHEYERQRRVGARRGHSVDATHPPTHLRRACLLTGLPTEAAVVLDDERRRHIAAELAPARAQVARSIVRDGIG